MPPVDVQGTPEHYAEESTTRLRVPHAELRLTEVAQSRKMPWRTGSVSVRPYFRNLGPDRGGASRPSVERQSLTATVLNGSPAGAK
jgi:hypothetical protein